MKPKESFESRLHDKLDKLLDSSNTDDHGKAIKILIPLAKKGNEISINNLITTVNHHYASIKNSSSLGMTVDEFRKQFLTILKTPHKNKGVQISMDLELFQCYSEGKFDIPKDLKLAFQHLKKASDDGSEKAQIKLATEVMHKHTTVIDIKECIDLLQTLAQKHNRSAYSLLGRYYEESIAVDSSNKKEAIKEAEHWFIKCIQESPPSSLSSYQYQLAGFYLRGQH